MVSKLISRLLFAIFLLLIQTVYAQPDAPTLIFPNDSFVFLPDTVSLEWNITGSNDSLYHLQISDNLATVIGHPLEFIQNDMRLLSSQFAMQVDKCFTP